MDAGEALKRLFAMEDSLSDGEILDFLERECPLCSGEPTAKAALYNELGSVCRRNRLFEKGEDAFLAAAKILEAAGISDGNYATTLNNLAGLYRLAGNYEKSREYFIRCRELYFTLPYIPQDVLASSFNNLGLLYLDEKRYSSAMEEFLEAEKLISDMPENRYVHAVTAGNMGYAHYGLGDMERARESMLRAARTASEFDSEMCENYMRLYRRLGGKEAK